MNDPDATAAPDSSTTRGLNAVIQRAVEEGARRYVAGCQGRVEGFVRRHYSFRGTLRIHRKALGWDVIRVPLNIIWSLVALVLALTGLLAGVFGLHRLKTWLGRVPPGLETDMDRQISWLVLTELLQLPYEQRGRQSERDALMAEILRDPIFRQMLEERFDGGLVPSRHPDFQSNLQKKLGEYGATRTGSADLAGNAALLITSKLAMGQAVFGAIGAGAALSVVVARWMAVSDFWLGSTIGSFYYGIVPVEVSTTVLLSVTLAVAVVLALISTFIGIVTDPLQVALGLHQRRLRKLIAAVGADLQGDDASAFRLREKYAGRLFDALDVMALAGKTV